MRAAATVAPPEAAEPVLPDVSPLPSAADLEPSDSPLSAPPSVAASNLTLVQSSALHELARRLTDRLAAGNSGDGALSTSTVPEAAPEAAIALSDFDLFAEAQAHGATARAITPILDRLPVGVLIYQLSHLLYANRAFLGWAGCKTVEALAEAGGLDSLLIESGTAAFEQDGDQTFTVTTGQGESTPAEGRLFEVPWDGETAYALVTMPAARAALDEPATAPPNPASWTNAEDELIEARRRAEQQSAAKSEFLAKVSHEVRDPLNAIIGFAEIMMEERFGPVGNDRYRQYLKDIHASSAHIMSLVNDLLDLSKIEAGRLELNFAGVALNDLVQRCVALMQPQANRERIIIRTSFAPKLPQVMADARSLRQIVLNLLSNSIKFTGAGGQVIVSTIRTDTGEVALHVRDTGIGMSDEELSIALEPFGQVAARAGSGGTGLGLPLTKVLAEANGAGFRIDSKPSAGTLVEVTFPRERVMGE
jgi:signal transduction histidine kinase